jgi:acetoin utilization protein AcuB
MIVSEAMNRALVAIEPDATIADAAALARRTGADHLLVIDEDTLVGILCACDLAGAAPADRVSDCMTVPVMTIRPDAPVAEAAMTMRECELGCLPVALGALVLGTVTDVELARCGIPPAHPHRRCHCRSSRVSGRREGEHRAS